MFSPVTKKFVRIKFSDDLGQTPLCYRDKKKGKSKNSILSLSTSEETASLVSSYYFNALWMEKYAHQYTKFSNHRFSAAILKLPYSTI